MRAHLGVGGGEEAAISQEEQRQCELQPKPRHWWLRSKAGVGEQVTAAIAAAATATAAGALSMSWDSNRHEECGSDSNLHRDEGSLLYVTARKGERGLSQPHPVVFGYLRVAGLGLHFAT